METITGNVTTLQDITGNIETTQTIFGEIGLAIIGASDWQSVSGKPFESLDETDFEVVEGVLKVIGGGGGDTSTLCWLPSVDTNGIITFKQSTSTIAPIPTSIKGTKGDTGTQGVKGEQGIQGLQGAKGDTGATGQAGTNGTNGFSPTVAVYENTDTSYILNITDVNSSYYTPNLKGSGGTGGSSSWGSITGTIADQTDLSNALAGKAPLSHNHTVSNITDFPNSMPASDVSAWAKSLTKPVYTASEVGALPNTTTIPTKTSQLTNDSNYVSDSAYTHTDNNFTSALKTSYDNAVTNAHSHNNKAVLDGTTASYTAADQTKLSGLSNYTLPTASTTTLGGIKVDGTSITVNASGVASASGGGSGLSKEVIADFSLSSSAISVTLSKTLDNFSQVLILYLSLTGGTLLKSNLYDVSALVALSYPASDPLRCTFSNTKINIPNDTYRPSGSKIKVIGVY